MNMKKYEKVLTACLTLALGLMLLVLRGSFIGVLMTILGVGLIVLGIMDLVSRLIPAAVIKLVCGVFVIVCGWVVVSAVLYVVAAILLVYGILWVYYNLKRRVRGCTPVQTVSYYVMPSVCIFIGVLLLFHESAINIILVICGILTIIDGGILLFNAIAEK